MTENTIALMVGVAITLLIFNIFITALAAKRLQQVRDVVATPKKNGVPNNTQLIETIAAQVAAIDREMNPKDGATLSYLIHELTKESKSAIVEAAIALSAARAAIEEARNVARTASEERSRLERMMMALQTTTETLLVVTARATEAAVKIIQNTVQGTQSTVEATSAKIDQLAVGKDMEQTITKTEQPSTGSGGIDQAQHGIDETQKGIDQARKDQK